MINYKIVEISDKNISSLNPLNKEALLDGDKIIQRTIDEWKTGKNTFSKHGEKFWGLFIVDKCIAIGGLNIDPFIENTDQKIGRVRHVYVAKKYRGQGLSKVIMKLIMDEANKNFTTLRLSTRNPIAASLYESLGFMKEEGHRVTHVYYDLSDRIDYSLKMPFNKKGVQNNWQKAENILKNDGVVVLPTDTLYGIVGRALSKKAVEKIYEIKGRSANKPFIILVASYKNLELFGVKIDREQAKFLEKIWPGKVSVILPCKPSKFKYIHRGTNGIAFRMIGHKNKNLFNLIKKTGPLVAPSVNPENEKPAESIKKAKSYFENKINLYINGGTRKFKPSTLIKLKNDGFEVLRQGIIKISKDKK